jgi:hypothetical protein
LRSARALDTIATQEDHHEIRQWTHHAGDPGEADECRHGERLDGKVRGGRSAKGRYTIKLTSGRTIRVKGNRLTELD